MTNSKIDMWPCRYIEKETVEKLGLFETMVRQRLLVVGMKRAEIMEFGDMNFTGLFTILEQAEYGKRRWTVGFESIDDMALLKLKFAGSSPSS